MMAKLTTGFNSKGELSVGEMKIFEIKKEEINTIDLLSILHKFDGKTVTITIKEDLEITGEEAPELDEYEDEE